MGYLNHECPHCGAHTAAFRVTYAYAFMGKDNIGCVNLRCGSCEYPASAILGIAKAGHGAIAISSLTKEDFNPTSWGWEIVQFFPEPKRPDIPEHLPEAVMRPLLSAEQNRHRKDYEGAPTMYGKALDVAFKSLPDTEGTTLVARIKSLQDLGKIPVSLAEMAHGLRGIRNDATHGIEPFTEKEVEELAEATKLILIYLFTLPGQIASLKKRNASK